MRAPEMNPNMQSTNSQQPLSPIESSWLAIEQMSLSLHTTATEKNWLDVLEAASTRHSAVLEHFEKFPIGPDNAEFYRGCLHPLLEGEKVLAELVRDARRSLMAEGMVTNRNHRAVGAYLSGSGA